MSTSGGDGIDILGGDDWCECTVSFGRLVKASVVSVCLLRRLVGRKEKGRMPGKKRVECNNKGWRTSSPTWREDQYKNAVLWWNLVLSCMRYRFPFSFLLQGNFEQNLIAPMPEDEN